MPVIFPRVPTSMHGFYFIEPKLYTISAWVGTSPAAETEQQGCSWLRRQGLGDVEANLDSGV